MPGTARENRPLNELTMEVNIAPHAFFEAPFHARWPSNGPCTPSPFERLQAAGRFIADDDALGAAEKAVSAGSVAVAPPVERATVVDAALDAAPAPDADPRFDSAASALLDAALGLDDDDDAGAGAGSAAAAPPPPPGGADADFLLD